MANRNIENASEAEKLERKKKVLNLLLKKCNDGKEMSERIKKVFFRLYRFYLSIQGKRQHSNESTFLRIDCDLIVTCEQMKTVESKLSLIQNEIRFLKTVTDSTNEIPEETYRRTEEKLKSILREAIMEFNESSDRLKGIMAMLLSVK